MDGLGNCYKNRFSKYKESLGVYDYMGSLGSKLHNFQNDI